MASHNVRAPQFYCRLPKPLSNRRMAMPEILQTRTAGTTSFLRRDLLTSAGVILVASLWSQRASATDVQKGWASCAKCRTIYFDGFPNKGHCAAGGAHSSGKTRVQLPFNTS